MNYSAGMVSKVFAFIEMRKTIELLENGQSKEDVKKRILEENTYQLRNFDRLGRTVNYIFERIESLPEDIRELFLKLDTENEKLIVLISIMKTDLLFFEFVYQVFRGKLIVGEKTIENRDVNLFFEEKAKSSDIVGSWSEAGIKKLKSCYIRNLVEAGLMDDHKSRNIKPAMVNYRLEELLRKNDMTIFFNAITGER